MRVIMYVRALAVLLLLVLARVVVTVGQLIVIVGVRVPVGLVVPVAHNTATMLMGNMVMVMAVRCRSMCVLRLSAFALSALWSRHVISPPAVALIVMYA